MKTPKRSNTEIASSFGDASMLTLTNTLDGEMTASQTSMSIQRLKRPDIFELKQQNSLIVKSTSNLLLSSSSNPSLIDFTKNENRLVSNKYHYYLGANGNSGDPSMPGNLVKSVTQPYFGSRRTATFVSEDSIAESSSIKRPGSKSSSQALLKSYKTQLGGATTNPTSSFFLTQDPAPTVYDTAHRSSRHKVDELSAESIKSTLESISMKQIRQNLENASSKSLNAMLAKKPNLFRSDTFTQQQKAKLKFFKQSGYVYCREI